MNNKKSKLGIECSMLKTKGKGIVEDATEYGEFIATFDAWLTPEEQKRKARYLEKISNENDKNQNIDI